MNLLKVEISLIKLINSKDTKVSANNNIDTEDISDNDELFNQHNTSLHKTSTLPCSAHQLPPPHP
jgi:hypothetical protein